MSAGLAPRLLRRARRLLLSQRWAAPLLAEWDRWRLLRALQRRPQALRRVLAPAELVADLPEAVGDGDLEGATYPGAVDQRALPGAQREVGA